MHFIKQKILHKKTPLRKRISSHRLGKITATYSRKYSYPEYVQNPYKLTLKYPNNNKKVTFAKDWTPQKMTYEWSITHDNVLNILSL